MKPMILAATLALTGAATATAETAITTPFDGSFDDATFAVESAILGQGLVIDHVSHVGDMLNRTAADVGSDRQLFKAADVFLFCSAVVSRAVMEADPLNIAHCPYGIFVTETEAGVTVGYRDYPDGPMQQVEDLLQRIVSDATAN